MNHESDIGFDIYGDAGNAYVQRLMASQKKQQAERSKAEEKELILIVERIQSNEVVGKDTALEQHGIPRVLIILINQYLHPLDALIQMYMNYYDSHFTLIGMQYDKKLSELATRYNYKPETPDERAMAVNVWKFKRSKAK